MKTFTKYFGDSIVVQNKEVEHYKYTGKFRQSRGVINALRLLQKDAPFTIEQDEDKTNYLYQIEVQIHKTQLYFF